MVNLLRGISDFGPAYDQQEKHWDSSMKIEV